MPTPEVRYQLLRPAQVVERRTECPVAYIPIGTLEWHGPQNPLGADSLQAEGLAVLCAQKGGGLVFPTLYYGESRVESLVDANDPKRAEIAKAMQLDPDNFLPERFPFSPMQQNENYQQLLIHILSEVYTLGFKVGVFVAGHYPLIDHARAAVLVFNKHRFSPKERYGMLAWACLDYLPLREKYGAVAGDHGAGWETSHLLHLHPEAVDMSTLPPKGQPTLGIGGAMEAQAATAQFGRETLEAAADWVLKEVHHRLAHPTMYQGHGNWLAEGLWKSK
ncbi:MAG TPA: creatininase family protein [Planctomycetota bacterium]|jgi:creatinine amidohydrolase